jgi:hypothetical protein
MDITNQKKSSFIKREGHLYDNFKNILIENPNNTIYTQLGSWHTTMLTDTIFAKTKNLVERLCIHDKLRSKICSIYPMYNQSIDLDYFSQKDRIELLNYAKNKMILIRLDGKNTPFEDFIDLFQYLLIIPRS